MAFTLADAVVFIRGDDSKLAHDLDTAHGKTESFVGNATKMIGGALVGAATLAGAAIVGIGVEGLKSFVAFEQQMNEVFTLLPDISAAAMGDMTDEVKKFAKEFGVLPEEVVPALYQALSAGVPPDNIFKFLATAQKAASGGVTELKTAVNGITSVVNAYGADIVDATEASDLMFTTVKLGKTNFEELSASLFNVVPTAAALGVEFGDVTAALAAMTLQGVPTAVATTQLRQLFIELSQDGGKASKMFQEMSGQTFVDFIAGGGNVADALKLMEQGAENSGKRLSDMFGSVEAGSAALALTGAGAKTFAADLAAMDSAAGATEKAFETMDSGIGASFAKLKALGVTTMLDIGGALAPLIEENLPAFRDMAETVSVAVVGFISAIPAAVAGIKAGWDEDWAGMRTTVTEFATAVPIALQKMWDEIDLMFQTEGDRTGDGWENFWGGLSSFFSDWVLVVVDSWTEALRSIRSLWGAISSLFQGDWEGFWNGMYNYMDSIANQMLNFIEFWFGPRLRDALAGALNGAWDGMKAIWEGISEWWSSTFGTLLGIDATTFEPGLNTINPNKQKQSSQQFLDDLNVTQPQAAGLGTTTNSRSVTVEAGAITISGVATTPEALAQLEEGLVAILERLG